jgi:hypothetical protein
MRRVWPLFAGLLMGFAPAPFPRTASGFNPGPSSADLVAHSRVENVGLELAVSKVFSKSGKLSIVHSLRWTETAPSWRLKPNHPFSCHFYSRKGEKLSSVLFFRVRASQAK